MQMKFPDHLNRMQQEKIFESNRDTKKRNQQYLKNICLFYWMTRCHQQYCFEPIGLRIEEQKTMKRKEKSCLSRTCFSHYYLCCIVRKKKCNLDQMFFVLVSKDSYQSCLNLFLWKETYFSKRNIDHSGKLYSLSLSKNKVCQWQQLPVLSCKAILLFFSN